MSNITISSLPIELLDEIFSLLDWDCCEHLCPFRPDILSISLTCWRLRLTVIPRIFQNVTLRLRWADGALVEPALLRLRKDHPNLTKYVRHVCVETRFIHVSDSQGCCTPFVVPEGSNDWLQHLIIEADQNYELERSHRRKVSSLFKTFIASNYHSESSYEYHSHVRKYIDELARKLPADEPGNALQSPSGSGNASELQRRSGEATPSHHGSHVTTSFDTLPTNQAQRIAYHKTRSKLDSLLLAVLCLPVGVTSLTCHSVHDRRADLEKHTFAMHVAATALDMFGDRLKQLRMITTPENNVRHAGGLQNPDLQNEGSIVTAQILQNLTQVSSLVLSDLNTPVNPRTRELSSGAQIKWHALAPTITQLELWNFSCSSEDLTRFTRGFTCLKSLLLSRILLHSQQLQNNHTRTPADQLLWPALLIELRRQLPKLDLRLLELIFWSERLRVVVLPESALRWLLNEAIPVDSVVGFDRETRLLEDYDSFLSLWLADDSPRGKQAMQERKDVRYGGKLVDTAMTNRWRTFENLR